MCLISCALIYLRRGVQAFRAERLPPQPCVLHGCPRLCLALCRVCAEQEEDVQHSQYILRGLTVSSCLCRWKQLYLNTACKLVFQNKGIIKARGRERGYQIFMHFKGNTINGGVLWLQTAGEFRELLRVRVPLWELGQATKYSDGHKNMEVMGKNVGKTKKREGERKKNANGSTVLSC